MPATHTRSPLELFALSSAKPAARSSARDPGALTERERFRM